MLKGFGRGLTRSAGRLEEVEGSLATSEKTREQTARDVTEASEAHDQAALEYAEAEDGRNQHGQYLRQVDSEAEAARRGWPMQGSVWTWWNASGSKWRSSYSF